MPRRPQVIALIAVLALAVVVPVVMLTLAGSPGPPDRTVNATDAADGAVAGAPLDAADVSWVMSAPLFGGPAETYSLQAGTLDVAAPVLDLQVPFGLDPNSSPGRLPAVGRVVDGSVVFVADDGARSSVRRMPIGRDAAGEELAVLDEVVYSLAVSPDGGHAYLALGDRIDPAIDRGIVRVSLDGQARTELVYDPAPGARSQPRFELAAIALFAVQVDISADGRHLVRYACAGPAGCASQVIDTATLEVTELGDRTVLGVAGGIAVTQQCAASCGVEIIDLGTGARQPLPGVEFEAAITLVEGRPRITFVDLAGGTAVLRALDPADGSVTDVFRAPAGSSITLRRSGPGLALSVPDGHLLADVSGEDVGAVVAVHLLAIRLTDGQVVELPPPAVRHELGDAQG